MKHKEEITALRQETMKIRKLESELKSLNRAKDKAEEQFTSHMSMAKSKLEKESANCTKLQEQLKAAEQRAK